ncbi:KpsF/GutQ family sugar-phosphate isomerase [Prochlorococcus marinus XMU1411]|uniref:KpsF/GutQ family sugar-phosphate isomerase n=1 Tax=Prochlorococcus marinus TaxID=1219 RepID=UPI001AD9B796|nr:KpsF/GutQ family sugar-phosphate isomerase [Prochlorococcus marinus]MBO8244226.1 KpsF/GutQ family sugar-phosphate isomerase [Prochlorococcus marinus XMU1411]MBW3055312.1 hypothetical protein [Prochlorococcus marinus str. MU1411]MCR8537054.1 KpsF/GutQ family sugar-phosphate isomerase [Prochlorococcus marinus CUG1430]
MKCEILISIGELVDKITILQIKSEKIKNPISLKNIKYELFILQKKFDLLDLSNSLKSLERKLFETNYSLWNVCEQRRNLDREKSFGENYVELSKLEYKLNDERAKIKKLINKITNSDIKEEKSYNELQDKDNYITDLEENKNLKDIGRKVINDAIFGLIKLNQSLNSNFVFFCEEIEKNVGKVIFCGIGKSGHIAKKLSATFSSLGISSIFLHASEALHGDMGVIKENDCVIFISKSGEANEFPPIISLCNKKKISVLAITFSEKSSLTKLIDKERVLLLPDTGEACSLGLAPTTSAIVTLSIGDAIALTVSQRKNHSKDDFAEVHPAGKLGKMLTPVHQVMHKKLPIIRINELKFSDILTKFIQGRFGIVGVVDEEDKLLGIISDFDLRKLIEKGEINNPISAVNKNFCRINKEITLGEAANYLKEKRIISCFVLEDDFKIVGLISVYDVLEII